MPYETQFLIPDPVKCALCETDTNATQMVHFLHADVAGGQYFGISLCSSCWWNYEASELLLASGALENVERYRALMKGEDAQTDSAELAIDGEPL